MPMDELFDRFCHILFVKLWWLRDCQIGQFGTIITQYITQYTVVVCYTNLGRRLLRLMDWRESISFR